MSRGSENITIFKDHRKLFEAAKDEVQYLASEQGDWGLPDEQVEHEDRNIGRYIIFYSIGGYGFHDDVNVSLQEKIQQIVDLSKCKFSLLRNTIHDGEGFIEFVFDWEQTDGNVMRS